MPLADKQKGLRERRALKAFQDDVYPGLVAAIHQAATFEVPVEVDWESMYHQKAHADFWSDNLEKVYFIPLAEALRSIAADDLGRDALKEAVRKVVIRNSDNRYVDAFSLQDGTLTFDHCPMSNVDATDARAGELVTFLEDHL